MSGPIPDLMLDVIAGKSTAPLETMQAWRAELSTNLDGWKRNQAIHRVGSEMQDAYRARLAEAYRRTVENAEMILAGLDRRIDEVENNHGR